MLGHIQPSEGGNEDHSQLSFRDKNFKLNSKRFHLVPLTSNDFAEAGSRGIDVNNLKEFGRARLAVPCPALSTQRTFMYLCRYFRLDAMPERSRADLS
jgi:hypothetical protein